MVAFTIEHAWDKGPKDIDWSKWWAPSKSMQKWLPWGSDKKSVLPQIKNFYLSQPFRDGCADLGVTIDEADLAASGCITFKATGKGSKEVIIDAATSLPIEAIYYMCVVQDKAKLQRICEFIDNVVLDENASKSEVLKQDLLNMIMTFHHILGTDPKNVTMQMLETCIADSNNYTPDQKAKMLDLLKKKREIIKAIMGLFEHMQLPERQALSRGKKEVRIVIDKVDAKALQQAIAMQKSLQENGNLNIQIIDIEYIDPKIKELIKKDNKSKESEHKPLVEERFSWLLSSVGELEALRKQFTQDGVERIFCGVGANTSEFVSGLGQALQVPTTLWAIDGDVPPAMKHAFIMTRDMQIECLVNDAKLARQYPDVCVLPGNGFDDLTPTSPPQPHI